MFFVRVEELVVGCRIRLEAYDDEGKADKQDTQDEERPPMQQAIRPAAQPGLWIRNPVEVQNIG